ncbi:flagellar assembly protein H [Oscillatoriales cyanobacterium USR001]|nr:flagellar assembly protein H [Oscillatoriales cyanobacterium USR001]
MIDHDRLFKELLSTFFVEFLELFLPEVAAYLEADTLEFLDKEVFTDITEGDRYEADLIAKIKFRNQETFFLIHIESQAQYQANFSQRMFLYFSRLSEKYGLPVYPIAVFSFNSPRSQQPKIYQVSFPNKVVLQFDYDVIQLNRLNWRDFLHQQNPVASALMAKMNIRNQERVRVKLECLRLLATLRLNPAKMKLISGFIDTYLRLNSEEESQLELEIARIEPSQQKVVMEIVTSWMEKGIEQGLQQGLQTGLQQGKQEEAVALILRQLPRRIGVVTPELQGNIRSLSVSQLEELAEALLDFSNETDLIAWLQQFLPDLLVKN